MKPARFEYERPNDLGGALALLGQTDREVKLIAGGQSLGPMLNLRLAQPELLYAGIDWASLADAVRLTLAVANPKHLRG